MEHQNKVFQKNINTVDGDCIQACIATLFSFEYEDAPVFDCNNWRGDFADFCDSVGVTWINVSFNDHHDRVLFSRRNKHLNLECLIAVDSFTLDSLHCVVGKIENGHISITHDPNPDNQGTDKVYVIRELDILVPTQTI